MKKLIVLISMICLTLSEMEDGISVLVPAGRSDCYFRELKVGDRMDLEIQVLSGGHIDIHILVLSPTGRIILDEQSVTETSTEIKIDENGAYKVCLDNTFSLRSDKVVYFDLGIDENNGTTVDHAELFQQFQLEKDDIDNTKDIAKSLDKIEMIFETIQEMQTRFRARYARHHYLQNANMTLVQWFSGASCFLMIMVGGLQVFLIRNLFKEQNAQRGMKAGL